MIEDCFRVWTPITQEQMAEIDAKFGLKLPKCKVTNEYILYSNTRVRIKKGSKHVEFDGTSHLTSKTIDGTVYTLKISEKCLHEKFPDTKTKNRVYNVVSPATIFAFDISEDDAKFSKSERAQTLENMINRYGDVEGPKRFEEYKKKQAYSNTFEYKQEKHGWTKELFDDFNKSRAVTLELCIERHGLEEGKKVYNNYITLQAYTNSPEYYLKKHGDQGYEIYKKTYAKRLKFNKDNSVSQKLFKRIENDIKDLNLNLYFSSKMGEKYYDLGNGITCLFDFFIEELNFVVEYYGEVFHANPSKFKGTDTPNPFEKDLTAEEIWENDNIRETLIKDTGMKFMKIWEGEENDEDLYNSIISAIRSEYASKFS